MTDETAASTQPSLCGVCNKPMDSPICCASCGALNALPTLDLDYFELFGLDRGFDLDDKALHRKYLSLSRATHPDVLRQESEQVRQQSLTISAELNRAYDTLRDPVSRAEYLLSLAGGSTAADDKDVPGELLGEVLMLREEIEEAQAAHDRTTLDEMRGQIEARHAASLEQITTLCRGLKEGDVDTLRKLRVQLNAIKYWDNLLHQAPADG